ncbi:class III extradiol dioxygenase subunit B-like domain-containing protein [Streptomyces sp. NBC_00539]|uniref:class III extradiol dioxygenase subunit B-like domain-containing protein n=1 Tax=Streptomyces sp. NBC_00539 TaxID=2975770 RepID=UPI002E81450F|nr:class III extradiol dioxygenase subunit B-like domain-containing protein [Streptomyces sp. NBC_00539]WUC64299.1 class III extradiol dioxygenase subunit B-like domain-containing protein [Streptomyces sp. NBC_00539]
MLVAAAVCPAPPLLVPEVAAGAAAELDGARTACSDALAVLAASRPGLLVVVGAASSDDQVGPYPQGSRGGFHGFGVDSGVRLGEGVRPGDGVRSGEEPDAGTRPLPPALAVGAWLLDHARWGAAPVEGLAVAHSLETGEALRAGRDLAAREDRVALLVMGDGSACRTLKAPGYLDERAGAFDTAAAAALATADTAALAGLDVTLAAELQAAGRAPWQVLAGAAEGAGLDGRLLYEDAPYGVGYFVAAWS